MRLISLGKYGSFKVNETMWVRLCEVWEPRIGQSDPEANCPLCDKYLKDYSAEKGRSSCGDCPAVELEPSCNVALDNYFDDVMGKYYDYGEDVYCAFVYDILINAPKV